MTEGFTQVLAPTIGASSPRPITSTATTDAVSTAAVDALGTSQQGWYSFAAIAAPVTIVFGNLSTMGAATLANGVPIAAGTTARFLLTSDTRYFRAIATGTATGQAVNHYRSGP